MTRGGLPSRATSAGPPVEPDPRRRNVHPDPARGVRREAAGDALDRALHQVGELDEGLAGSHAGEAGLDQLDAVRQRAGDERQARHHRRDAVGAAAERAVEIVGIALYDPDAGNPLTPHPPASPAVSARADALSIRTPL